MSEQTPETYSEDIDDLALTPEQREEADVYLDEPEAVDDVPWTPPEQRPIGAVMAEVPEDEEETIDQRIRQEEPEEGTAYGAPSSAGEYRDGDPERDLVGGDDPDAIAAEEDFSGPAL